MRSISRRCAAAACEIGRGRGQRRVRQQRPHDVPAGRRYPRPAAGPRRSCCGCHPSPDPVEPVAGVVAVAVQRLRAQHVLAHLEEGHALGQADQAGSQVLAAHAVGHGGGGDADADPAGVVFAIAGRQLEDVLVEQRLVVVLLDVVDGLLRVGGEGRPGRSSRPTRRAGRRRSRGPQVGLVAAAVLVAVPVVAQAVDEALPADCRGRRCCSPRGPRRGSCR